ncbi:mCG123319, isoform CRA_a [Mus musculus]|nr:mCG123319, isoform CRA_a [Mus musculus]EDL21131.1 mCG123319, isoform CRA_a [Mus musculus]
MYLLSPTRLRARTARWTRPRPLPAGWTRRGTRLLSPQPLSAAIDYLPSSCPPTAKLDWCLEREVGEGKLIMERSLPPTRPNRKVTWRFTPGQSPPHL